jgi:predicted TIM-barrel fold metal-dependent hydrolase
MHNEYFVIDAVGHTYDFSADNRKPSVPVEFYDGFIGWLYGYGHEPLEKTSDGYLLSLPEWAGGWTTEELLEVFFVESGVDMVAMHAVNFYYLFERGANPWEQCVAVKQAAPERTLLYAAVDPLSDRLAEFDKMAEAAELGINGFKFYPVSGLTDARNHAVSYSFADDAIYPFFEHARSLGINHLAIHKALPTGPGPNDHDRPEDVAAAASSFPDMTFEVVHSGWAFLEDCAVQMTLNANIYANLETTANAIVRMPRRFARSVGTLLSVAPDRVLFGSGAPLTHPQPIVEAIADFEMPSDLLEEGLPEFTDEVKADILGLNMARLHGIDVEAVKALTGNDDLAQARAGYLADRHTPWSRKKERVEG